MHIKKNILFVLIIFVFQLIPPVMAYNKTENPILFETDFENCRKNYFPGLEFVYNLRAEVSQVDAEHGKSVGLNANNMIYWIDNPWKDGCYSLSFDFYDTAKGQFNYLRAIFDKNESIYDANNLCELFSVSPDGKMGYFTNQQGWTLAEGALDYEQNRWYSIDIWFDFNKSTIYYYIDGERIGSDGMSKFTGAAGFMFLMQGSGYMDNILIREITEPALIDNSPEELKYMTEENLIKIDVSSEAKGNVFFNDEVPELNLDIKNTDAETQIWDIDFGVTDEHENEVFKKEYDKTKIEPGKTFSDIIKPGTDKFGIYKIKIIADNGHDIIERESEFSMVHTPPEGIKNDKMGVCTHIGQEKSDVDSVVQFVDRAGFAYTRDEIYWHEYEETKGIYEMPVRLNDYIEALGNNGVEMFDILAYGNYNYMNGGDWHPTLPFQLDGYEEFCYRLASELKGRVNCYEVWNEWCLTQCTPEQYAEVLRRAYRAVKRADSDAMVVGFCTAGTTPTWIEDVMVALNGEKCFDAISVHPYCFPGSPENTLAYNITQVEDLMEKYNYEDAELWGTEVGFPTTALMNTEKEQAVYGVLYYCVNDAENLMDRVYWYDLQNDGWNSEEQEHNFGLIRSWDQNGDNVPFAAKPSYLALSQYNAMTAGTEFESRINTGNDNISMYHYKNGDGKDILVTVSKNGETELLSLKLDTESVNLYDMYGNMETVYGSDGKFAFAVGDTISYIEGNFKGIENCDSVISLSEPYITAVEGSDDEISIYYQGSGILSAAGTDNISIEECTAFINGEGKIKYRSGRAKKENEVVKIRIEEDGKLFFTSELPVKYMTSLTVDSIEVKPYSEDDSNHWMAEIKITNNSLKEEIGGMLNFLSPESMISEYGEVSIAKIQPKGSDKLYIHLPGSVRSMNTIKMELETDLGEKIELETMIEGMDTATRFKSGPDIDGELSEWDFDGAMYINDVEKFTGAGYSGLSDLSGVAKIMWDDEKIYFAAEITDDVHYQESPDAFSIWKYDSIQLGIASEKEVGVFTELGLALMNNGPYAHVYSAEKGGVAQGALNNAELAIVRKGTKTIYEFSVPWDEFLPDSKELNEGESIYVSILINENDKDGRERGWMEYGGGIASVKTASQFVKVTLN